MQKEKNTYRFREKAYLRLRSVDSFDTSLFKTIKSLISPACAASIPAIASCLVQSAGGYTIYRALSTLGQLLLI